MTDLTTSVSRTFGSIVGLTSNDVLERERAGQTNVVEQRTTRSTTSIIRANVLTRFNAIVTALVVVILVFGDPIDAVFGLVMVCNSLIGIVQEIRAKRSLARVQVLLAPTVTVYRDLDAVTILSEALVLDDVIELVAGDQVPVDAVVLQSHGMEVDESALTGESVPVVKCGASTVRSGSFVVAGSAVVRATRIGDACWINQLTREAQTFVLTESELRLGVDRILRTVGWLLPPLSVLLVVSQLRASAVLADGLVAAVSGVVALVPQGLVLLVSVAFAVAVIRLARVNVVVQELPAVEGLARIDVLCVDKTGTLTTGRLSLEEVLPFESDATTIEHGVAALARLEESGNATMAAIRAGTKDRISQTTEESWNVSVAVPFSSVRKWSAAEFDHHGAWFLGAPEILLDACSDSVPESLERRLNELAEHARRVLLVARASALDGESLPHDLRPVGLISMKEEVRPDAAETMAYFAAQGVTINVISGDNPITVAAVAAELGILGAHHAVDLRGIDDLSTLPPETVVYGRVLPEQKRDLVRALQQRGHIVGMTGDGVNDIPALKAADIGIAMDTATTATKAVAQLVLLDGRFDRLPGVVREGRRVIANMERVSALFITKTTYAALLVLAVGLLGVSFPFLPRHLSLVATFTIGVPAFILSFRSSDAPCRPGYLRRVMYFAIPSGVFVATSTFAVYWWARSAAAGATLSESRTLATTALTIAGLVVLHRLVRPAGLRDVMLIVTMFALFVANLAFAPLARFYALTFPELGVAVPAGFILLCSVLVYELVLRISPRLGRAGGTS